MTVSVMPHLAHAVLTVDASFSRDVSDLTFTVSRLIVR